MSGSINKVILIGSLGRDPEVRAMQDGREVVTLSLATSESWKDKQTGERKEKTEWHRVVCFNESLCRVLKEYARKGSKLYVEGSLQTRKWVNKDGVDQYSTEIVLQNFNGTVVFLSKAERGDDEQPQRAQVSNVNDDLDDEIPF